MTITVSDIAALSRLLDDALELAPGRAREQWMRNLPETDAHLAPMLRQMLAEHEAKGCEGFLTSLPDLTSTPIADEAQAEAGQRIGPYRLLHEIGRGGMGTVWLAERADGSFKRQVALKLPRLAWGRGLAERMAREREIGALLEHPNIARLYDAGLDERGRPYLALEHIAGQPIDAWCQAHALTVRERLKLIVQVARAVSYAHGRLVVHRDLKPSNVLVTDDGQTHLLDFGIAKLLHDAGDAGLTQEQGRVLTPHFASPEQMRGEAITVQSDVYSLGVLLYELLTGQTPYTPKRKTLAALEEAVLEGEASLASNRAPDKATARQLKGEIDTILAKALRREPGERYATADALAADIEHHLAGERVLAQADSAWYRLRKTVRRHRVGVVAATVTTLAVIGGAGAALVQAHRANAEAARVAAVRDFMVEMMYAAEPDEAHPDTEVTARQVVLSGIARARVNFGNDPRLRGALLGELARVQERLGDAEGASLVVKEANQLLERFAPPDDPALNRTRQQLGDIAFAGDDLSAAGAFARSSLAACTQAGSDCAKVRSYDLALLGNIELRAGRTAEAMKLFRQSISEAELGFGSDHRQTAGAWYYLAVIARNTGSFAEASDALDHAQAIAARQTMSAYERFGFSRLQALLALDLGHFESARTLFMQRVAQTRRPEERATELRLLAQALLALGLPDEARLQADAAIALAEPAWPLPERMFARQARARALGLTGASAEALADIVSVIDGLQQAGYAPTTVEVLRARRFSAEIMARAGHLEAAATELRAVAEAQAGVPGGQAIEQAQTLDLLGTVSRSLGRAPEALAAHDRAAALLAEALPADHPWRQRNLLYRALAQDAVDAGDIAQRYAALFPQPSVWRAALARCRPTEAASAPPKTSCSLFL